MQAPKVTRKLKKQEGSVVDVIDKISQAIESRKGNSAPSDTNNNCSTTQGVKHKLEGNYLSIISPTNFRATFKKAMSCKALTSDDVAFAAAAIDACGDSIANGFMKQLEKCREARQEVEKAAAAIERQKKQSNSAIPFKLESGMNDKLKFTLQNPREFALDTTYRKRDKFSDMPGVSLLVGNKDKTGGEEVIAILFDDDR